MDDRHDKRSHCYRVRLPSEAEARRLLDKYYPGHVPSEEPGRPAILCGTFGEPCFHCGGIPEALCDFPIGDEGRTCDRSLCLACAPTFGADKNYCHEHDEYGRNMLLFPQPKRTLTPPGPALRKRAKPLPKAPPESHRWRVRQGRDGAALTQWMTQIEARLKAKQVGGYVETWEEFVKLWRTLYPLKPRTR